jgi:hypothetical protein
MHLKMTRFVVVLLFFLSGNSFAGNSQEDSLMKRLQQVGGKEKIKTLYTLGNRMFYVNSSEVGKYFSKGLRLVNKRLT